MTRIIYSGQADLHVPDNAAQLLRATSEIRARANTLLARARAGESRWFTVDDAGLDSCAALVASTTRERYDKLDIPYHSRWRHFQVGGVDRAARLGELLEKSPGGSDAPTRARAQIDLAVVSVLLDAGAGPDWGYTEPATGARYTRSEGLAVASFHAFTAGLFSSDPSRPLQSDAQGLRALPTDRLAEALQVSDANPLVGLAGRATLLRRLGEVLAQRPEYFGQEARPGALFDLLADADHHAVPPTAEVTAHSILSALLDGLSAVWPAQNLLVSPTGHALPVALGDCWRHEAVRVPGLTDGWMPFHKLSQWLAYSLIEPFEWAGVRVTGVDALTALPEYRNGGLLIDAGVLHPRDVQLLARSHAVGDECVVEWRALTVALLDEIAPLVRDRLGLDAVRMPLACVLEGGTWAAGRTLAQRLRGGTPPLQITSDGTVF